MMVGNISKRIMTFQIFILFCFLAEERFISIYSDLLCVSQ